MSPMVENWVTLGRQRQSSDAVTTVSATPMAASGVATAGETPSQTCRLAVAAQDAASVGAQARRGSSSSAPTSRPAPGQMMALDPGTLSSRNPAHAAPA